MLIRTDRGAYINSDHVRMWVVRLDKAWKSEVGDVPYWMVCSDDGQICRYNTEDAARSAIDLLMFKIALFDVDGSNLQGRIWDMATNDWMDTRGIGL